MCPKGHQCQRKQLRDQPSNWIGALHPEPCMPGTYAAADGTEKCSNCPAGQFCPLAGQSETFKCPAGHYCPEGSIKPEACKETTYNPDEERADEISCIPCPAGQYCNSKGLAKPTDLCPNGYNCFEVGIDNPFQDKYKCAKGATCYSTVDDGSKTEPCKPGTFNPREYGNSDDDC